MNLKNARDLVLLYSSTFLNSILRLISCYSVLRNIFLIVHITPSSNSCFWYCYKMHLSILRILLLECSSLILLCYLAHPRECYFLIQACSPLTLSSHLIHHVNHLLARRSQVSGIMIITIRFLLFLFFKIISLV